MGEGRNCQIELSNGHGANGDAPQWRHWCTLSPIASMVVAIASLWCHINCATSWRCSVQDHHLGPMVPMVTNDDRKATMMTTIGAIGDGVHQWRH
jgi:hypothetical protein